MTPRSSEQVQSPGMSRGLTLLFAIAGGAAVGNLYWAQPLLADIARSLDVSTGPAGLLVAMTQVGYAVGILLIVPLGDSLDRRRLIPAMMACSSIALAVSAFAPTFVALTFGLAAVGFTTVSGQLLTPLAGDLSKEEERGRVVGAVTAGLLTGILTSRVISGLVADAFGWRAIYLAAAAAMFVIAVVLARALPSVPPRASLPYGRLLASVFDSVRRSRSVQVTLAVGAAGFSVFAMFWTGLTFLLSSPPFSYAVDQIGLVGLAGLAGALAARRAGRLHDFGWSAPATAWALALALASLVVAGLGSGSLIVILIAVVMIDIAIQALNVLNQTRLFALAPQARSRLNTAFVASNFVGAACGSAVAALVWPHGGWRGLLLAGGVLLGFALALSLFQRRALASA